MSAARLIVVLAIGWVAVTGGFNLPNLVFGAVIAAIIAVLLRNALARPLAFRRVPALLALVFEFLKELLLGALSVAQLVVMPNLQARLRPAIIAFPLTATSDAEITLLANLITLTPGTFSLDVSPDRRHLYIHVLALKSRESFIHSVASGLEQKVVNVFR